MSEESIAAAKRISWSLDPLLHGTLPAEAFNSVFDLSLLQFFYLTILLVSVLYPIVHVFLQRFFETYNKLTPQKQQTTLHHAVEVLVLATFSPLMTYWMLKMNFQVQNLEDTVSAATNTAKISGIIMTMYTMELSSRYNNTRPIILVHHVLAYLNGFLMVRFPSTIILKTASTLVYFIFFEVLTFVGLVMYRIFPKSKMTPKVNFAGMVLFGTTRPLQLLWVAAAIVPSWHGDNIVKWHAWSQIIITGILTVLQLMTLKIHYSIWKRCIREQMKRTETSSTFAVEDGENETKTSSTFADNVTETSSTSAENEV